MIGRKIIDSKDITLGEVSEVLNVSTGEELGFEQSKTLEYAKKFEKIPKGGAETAIEELMQIEKISRQKAVKIVDIAPTNEAEVRVIFVKEIFTLSDEDVKKIIDIVGKHVRKK